MFDQTTLFAVMLGIEELLYFKAIWLNKEAGELHIDMSFREETHALTIVRDFVSRIRKTHRANMLKRSILAGSIIMAQTLCITLYILRWMV